MARYNITNSMIFSLMVSLGLLGYGLYSFISQWQYSEAGHEYLLIAYCAGAILTFFTLRMSRNVFALIFIACMGFILLYSNAKFEWRYDYIQSAHKGQYFPLEQYIDQYPTFEANNFAWMNDKPNWVAFNQDCYEPLLKNQGRNINRNCEDASEIMEHYNIDIKDIIRTHYKKMQSTAQFLEKGRLGTKKKFEACINTKRCAMIPLLPKNVTVVQQSTGYLNIRKQFWALVNNERMMPEHCAFFDLCRVMVKADIVNFDEL